MKKLNRILSAAVAACMSLTMFAGAAELDSAVDAPETETLTGTATIITEDGVVYKPFEYTLPEGVDEEEADEIILQSAAESAEIAPVSRATSYRYRIGYDSDFWIPANRTNSLPCDELEASGGFLEVLMSRITDSNNVTITCDGATHYNVRVSQGEVNVIFFSGSPYGGDTCWLKAGVSPDLFFSADQECDSCRVKVYHNY